MSGLIFFTIFVKNKNIMIKLQLYFNMLGWVLIFITWGMQLKSNQTKNFKTVGKLITYGALTCFVISLLIYFLNK